MKLLLAIVLLGAFLARSEGVLPVLDSVHTKFEYKSSFRAPRILDSRGNVPFWTHGGSAIPSDDYLRVCPSVRSHRGWAWSKEALQATHWMIDVSVRITGRLKAGADGMAIWVMAEAGTEGPVYGSADRWKGVGLFLDSFDNDAKDDNPKIQLVLNDGLLTYDHRSDGAPQQTGSCLKDFRNKPYPVKLRLTFIRGVMEVWVHDGVSVMEDDYELCVRVEDDPRLQYVPENVHVGVSAATGGLSDDHDVNHFLTYSVQTNEERATKKIMENNTVFSEWTDEYSKMSGEFDQRREAYLKEHPGAPGSSSNMRYDTGDGMDWQKRMELDQSMQMVSEMQRALHKEIQSLGRKIDMLLTMGPGAAGAGAGGGGAESSLMGDLSQIRATEGSILSQLADLRGIVERSSGGGGGGVQGGIASEQLQPLYEIKNIVGQQKDQFAAFTQHLQELSQHRCPTAELVGSPCLSPWLFVAVMVVQAVVYIGYCLYSQAQERRAKKFF